MYYMLFGAVPFTDESDVVSIAGQMRAIVEKPLKFPQDHSISPPALALIGQLLEKDPDLRISLDSALLSPWMTDVKLQWPSSLKRLPSGLPDNEMLPGASEQDVRHAVINVSNWSLLVKVKMIASRHVQGFRERRQSQGDLSASSSTESPALDDGASSVPPLATSSTSDVR
jgi:serine/threonine protein kinase